MLRLDLLKWYAYKGKIVAFEENRHNPEYLLELHPGNVFGVRKLRGKYQVVHKNSPTIPFTLKKIEIDRLIEHSNGWKGKVRKITVNAGVGGLDKPAKPVDEKIALRVLEIDSSNLKACTYDKKAKNLYVEFRNGAVWVYEKVTEREANELEDAPSQGRYFIYRIRETKPQYRIDVLPYSVKDTYVPLAPAQLATESTPESREQTVTPVTIDHSGKLPKVTVVAQQPKNATMPKANNGKKVVKIRGSAKNYQDWAESEEGSYADHDESKSHVYAIIKRKEVKNETELLKMLGSLSSSTFMHVSQTGFRAMVKTLLSVGNDYPFTPSGAKTFDAVKAQLQASAAVTTQEI